MSWIGVAVVVAGFVSFGYANELDRRQHAIRPEDGCLAFAPPPAVTLALDDRTDPLAGDQPHRWRAALDAEIARLGPGSVLLVGDIGPTTPAEEPLKKLCTPLVGRGPQASRLQAAFNRSIDTIGDELLRSPSTNKSAISGTIIASASDPAFRTATTGPRRIEVASDLLENDVASAYRPSPFSLPEPQGQPLKGVAIHFTVLRNLRDDRFQTRQLVDAWIRWATKAGASSVSADAPWLGIASAPAPRDGSS
jgi:hypothetical protein